MGTKKESNAKTYLLAVLAAVFIAFAALYASDVFDNDEPERVRGKEYASGEYVYSGTLEGGLFSEFGNINFDDGNSYSGGFKDGRFDGKGIFTKRGGDDGEGWLFEGIFEGGQPVSGVFYFDDGSQVVWNEQD